MPKKTRVPKRFQQTRYVSKESAAFEACEICKLPEDTDINEDEVAMAVYEMLRSPVTLKLEYDKRTGTVQVVGFEIDRH